MLGDNRLQIMPYATAAPPSARFGHALTAIRDQLCLFGGWTGEMDSLKNDLWFFSTSTFAWVRVKPTPGSGAPAPTPRQGHVMVYDEPSSSLVVYGGWTASASSSSGGDAELEDDLPLPCYVNDVREFSLVTNNWSRVRATGMILERYSINGASNQCPRFCRRFASRALLPRWRAVWSDLGHIWWVDRPTRGEGAAGAGGQ
jgi:hypothetical protein